MEEILTRIKEESKNNTENYIFPLNAQKKDLQFDNNNNNFYNNDNFHAPLNLKKELKLVNFLKEYSISLNKIIESYKDVDYDSSIKDWMEFQITVFNHAISNPRTKTIRKKRLLVYKYLNEYLLYQYNNSNEIDEFPNLEDLNI